MPLSNFINTNSTYDSGHLQRLVQQVQDYRSIVSCRKCSFIYSEYTLTNKLNIYLYEKVIDWKKSFNKTKTAGKQREFRGVFDTIKPLLREMEIKVLDYGCGWGDLLCMMKTCGYKNSYGFDISAKRLNWIRTRGINVLSSHELIEKNAPYNLIIAYQFLEHDPDFLETLYFLRSVLTDAGFLYVNVPNASNMFQYDNQGNLILKSKSNKNVNPWEHVNYFSADTLRSALEKTAFNIFDTHSLEEVTQLTSTDCFAKKS